MERAITRNEGEINNYMGDGLMALFGLHDHDGAPLQAVNAGLQMIDEMEHLKPYLTAIYGRAFEVGIGIHCGEVVVGSIGSGNTSRITAIGDVVNLASRIESANKQAGTRLLISQDTFNLVAGSITVGKVIQASLQGKSGEYALYEVTGVKIG
jgi:adenylate cyclase